jgi:hypothetical protein
MKTLVFGAGPIGQYFSQEAIHTKKSKAQE